MALTEAEQAELARLQAQANAPDPRTGDGLKGVLHTILDVVSGDVAHLGAGAWQELHRTVETYDQPPDDSDGGEPGTAL